MTTTYTIICAILGETTSFSVDIANNKIVDHLKDAIKEKRAARFAGVDAAELTLYHVEIPDNEDVATAVEQKLSNHPTKLWPTEELAVVFKDGLKRRTIHVLVQPRSIENDQLGHLSKKRKIQVDLTEQLVARWSQPVAAQTLSILCAHLQQPLTEEEKVPISQLEFNKLVTPPSVDARHALAAEELATLCRVSEDEDAYAIETILRNAITRTPPAGGTEDAFHSTWDGNISYLLQLALSTEDFVRNSNKNTSTGLKRPDYGLLINNNCLVRGEEKPPESSDDPKAELIEKLLYTYDPLEYILGYYAFGAKIFFVAISRPPSKTEPLYNHDLRYKRHRVFNLVHIIRLCGVISWMDQQLDSRNNPEFKPFVRPDGLTRITIGAVVKKEFMHPDGITRVSHLVEIYKSLEDKQVPNVDVLNEHSMEPPFPYVMVTPVGIDRIPNSGLEAFNAVVCILQALKVMHSEPSPVYHRDIRQPNIIKKYDSDAWFLVDWSDASTAPTRAAAHLSKEGHSPRVHEDNHGAEVDMWGVGHYLKLLASRSRAVKADKAKQMAERWMRDYTVTAETALNEMNTSQDLFFAPEA